MTEPRNCTYCGRPYRDAAQRVGRPRLYCRRSCRQRAFEARRHDGDLAWSDARLVEMIRSQAELEDRLDRVHEVLGDIRADIDDEQPVGASEVVRRVESALGKRQNAR